MMFSVITVTYNNLTGLKRTAESVLAQTFGDFEWIVVDGGSEDGSAEFLSSLTEPKLASISEKDNGIFDAMNKGIRMSSGRYCIFMNAGDLFATPATLQTVADASGQADYCMIYGDTLEEGDGQFLLKKARKVAANRYSMFTHHQSIFYRRQSVLSGYDLSYRYSADWALTTRLLTESPIPSLYVDVPISIFERGGISQRDDQRARINREHWRILRDEAKLGYLQSSALWFVKTRINHLRKLAPNVYDFFRFRAITR